jgi:hypothetical protein
MTTSFLDKDADIEMTTRGILQTFLAHLQRQCGAISVDLDSVIESKMVKNKTVLNVWRDLLDPPISMKELKTAVNKGAGNKAPRRDGICLEFFKTNRDRIKDDILARSTRCIGMVNSGTAEAWDSSMHTEDAWAHHTDELQTHNLAKH